MSTLRIEQDSLGTLITVLKTTGFKVIAPTFHQATLSYTEIESAAELPQGYRDQQAPGKYQLTQTAGKAFFNYNLSFDSIKKILLPRPKKLWQAERDGLGFTITEEKPAAVKYAFIGVRACDIAALKELDKVFIEGEFKDRDYQTLREAALIIAVNCATVADNCFCASMNTGPEATYGFDILLTEVLNEAEHFFTTQSATDKGAAILAELPLKNAAAEDSRKAQQVIEHTKTLFKKELDTKGIKELFYNNYESSCWNEVAEKCLACANCTLVCPTCFCSTVEDSTDLAGKTAQRRQVWDSCFSIDFSYLHGGAARQSIKSRYRQWISHKLAAWHDQFGSSGCVGCGRCITWCPVGIDITAEAKKLREEALKNDSLAV